MKLSRHGQAALVVAVGLIFACCSVTAIVAATADTKDKDVSLVQPTAPSATKKPAVTPSTKAAPSPSAYPTKQGITPGAFCRSSEHRWYGLGKSNGLLYRCTLSGGDTRWRWHQV